MAGKYFVTFFVTYGFYVACPKIRVHNKIVTYLTIVTISMPKYYVFGT